MFSRQELENLLVIDVETVSAAREFSALPPRLQALWEKKAGHLQKWEEHKQSAEELYGERAAIFAEFGKVVCISSGYLRLDGDSWHLRLKSFAGHDESAILSGFASILTPYLARPDRRLCAHNGKEFDFPFLGRRYLANGLDIPDPLRVQGKKPWETAFVDTMELWRFGDFKSFTSLELLTAVLGIESPKDDMDGAAVGPVYWEAGDLDRITQYCQQDVIATAQILLRFSGQPLLDPELEISQA